MLSPDEDHSECDSKFKDKTKQLLTAIKNNNNNNKIVHNKSKERSDWNYTSRRVRTTRNWRRNDLTKNADAVDLLLRSNSIFFVFVFVFDSTIFSRRFLAICDICERNEISSKGLSSRDWAERNKTDEN